MNPQLQYSGGIVGYVLGGPAGTPSTPSATAAKDAGARAHAS